eukprot:6489684-Amphidinium_carterae.1
MGALEELAVEVQRDVLRQGEEGCRPNDGDRVQVHYTCTQDGASEIMDSTYAYGEPLSFTLGQDEVIPGLEQAVREMEVGEKAAIRVPGHFAHSEASWSSCKPSCSLLYELELVGTGPPGRAVSPEQRVVAALRAKDVGNASFKSGSLQAALDAYADALRDLAWPPYEAPVEWTSPLQDERKKLALACCLNLAQCELKLQLYAEAAVHAEQ